MKIIFDSALEIVNKLTIPSNGLFIKSIKYVLGYNNRSLSLNTFLILHNNFSFSLINLKNKELTFYQSEQDLIKSPEPIDFENKLILFRLLNKSLLITDTDNLSLFEINGKFTNGCFYGKDKIIGVEYENLTIYGFKRDDDKIRIWKLGSINAHYDEITFFLPKDNMLLTASKDSSMKVFLINMLEPSLLNAINSHKSVNRINELIIIDEEHVISKMDDSK